MSQQKEERARQKFSDKMRQKSLAAKNAKQHVKKTEDVAAPPSATPSVVPQAKADSK